MKTAAAVLVVFLIFNVFKKEDAKTSKAFPVETRPPVVEQQAPSTDGDSVQIPDEQQKPQPAIRYPVNANLSAEASARSAKVYSFARTMKLDQSINDELLKMISDSIVFYADKHNIDSALAAALIARESRFNPNAVSPSAAKGLGQLIDSTAANMGVSDPFDIDQNLDGSFKYFRQMLDIWQGNDNQLVMALAGYLTGPRVVKDCNCVPNSSQPYITDIINYAETISGGK